MTKCDNRLTIPRNDSDLGAWSDGVIAATADSELTCPYL
jgi:hypothetical protein